MLYKYILICTLFASTICYSQAIDEGRTVPNDHDEIRLDICNRVNRWLKKDEFEKTEQHKVRITQLFATAFDSICYEATKQSIANKLPAEFQVLQYNADTEKFGIRLKFHRTEWTDSLQIPKKNAPAFKKEAKGFLVLIDKADWQFADGNLIPVKLQLSGASILNLESSQKNTRPIRFSSSEVGVAMPDKKTALFDYTKYLKENGSRLTQLEGNASKSSYDDKVFENVEIEASVNAAQWRRHLENHLVRYIENAASSGMAAGNYTVYVRFIVEKDGSIADIKALNDPGYGLAQGAVEIVMKGPRWSPGEQNGKKVISFHTQPITFQLQEQ